MPQWAGSSGTSCGTPTRTTEEFCAKETRPTGWAPPDEHGPDDPGGVDLYVGGVEHAVLHLLYCRFWHKVLYDLGHVTSREPHRRLVNQGYIQAFAYTDAQGPTCRAADVIERAAGSSCPAGGGADEIRFQEFGKIGKSLKNSISPTRSATTARTPAGLRDVDGPLEASRRGPPRTWWAPTGSCSGCGGWSSMKPPASQGFRGRAAGRADAAAAAPHHRRVSDDYASLRVTTPRRPSSSSTPTTSPRRASPPGRQSRWR